MKTQARARAPIVKELHYSKEDIAEVKRIQSSEKITTRKEKLRNVIGGPMCSICSQLPTRRIEYHLEGVTRIEAYCDEHFSIYEKNRDVDINDIMEAYGCQRAPCIVV